MINQKLNNRYTILSLLGEGGMGEVYLVNDEQTKQQVAIKILARQLSTHPETLERFRREAKTLRQLEHPNIVKFIDAFEYEKQYVIVMEYMQGGSLFNLLKKGPLPIERAREIALGLCDALTRSHQLNIIHRDIKPENVLIDENGTPKLADFGVARLSEGTRMTRTGTQVGTPYYMSPEAWEGKSLDGQADVWSLGALLFEMLSGQIPFQGDTPLSVMNKIFTSELPDLNKLRKDIPSALIQIVSRMLTRDKDKRYKTMRQVAVDLEAIQIAKFLKGNNKETFIPTIDPPQKITKKDDNTPINIPATRKIIETQNTPASKGIPETLRSSTLQKSNTTSNKQKSKKRFLIPSVLLGLGGVFFFGILIIVAIVLSNLGDGQPNVPPASTSTSRVSAPTKTQTPFVTNTTVAVTPTSPTFLLDYCESGNEDFCVYSISPQPTNLILAIKYNTDIDTNNLPQVTVGGNKFKCELLATYPGRIYCTGASTIGDTEIELVSSTNDTFYSGSFFIKQYVAPTPTPKKSNGNNYP